MLRPFLVIMTMTMLMSCAESSQNSDSSLKNDSIPANRSSQNELKENHSNVAIIDENCVIFMWPDSNEIAKLKAENSEEDYNEIVADLTWYPGIATEVLDSFKIKSVSCDEEYIILRNSKKEEFKLKRKELNGDMILFRIDKEPIFSSAIEFDRELTLKYFDKR